MKSNEENILVYLRFLLPTLPSAERKVAQCLLGNSEIAISSTLAILAQVSGTSEATVIRLCKRLGFDGFTDMKKSYVYAIIDENKTLTQEVEANDSFFEIFNKVCESNSKILKDTLELFSQDYEKALDAILNANTLHFFGNGDAIVVAKLAQMKFERLGLHGSAHSDVIMQYITAGGLKSGDVALSISYSGASTSVVNTTKIAKEMGATTICITKINKSPLLKHTDINLFTATSDFTIGKDIIAKRVADQAILDALYLGYLTKKQEDFSQKLRDTQKAIDNNKL